MIAGNIFAIITMKYPKTKMKSGVPDMLNEKQIIAVLGAACFWGKNTAKACVRHV